MSSELHPWLVQTLVNFSENLIHNTTYVNLKNGALIWYVWNIIFITIDLYKRPLVALAIYRGYVPAKSPTSNTNTGILGQNYAKSCNFPPFFAVFASANNEDCLYFKTLKTFSYNGFISQAPPIKISGYAPEQKAIFVQLNNFHTSN